MKKGMSSSRRTKERAGTLDWGSYEFKTHESKKEGAVMLIASTDFATIQKENTIKHAADSMYKNKIRRLFVTEPDGTLLGILTATDIVDFLGGGDRFKIIAKKHFGNLLAAINEPVREIMNEKPITINSKASMKDAIKILHKTKVGYIPIVKDNKILAVVTERHFMNLIAKHLMDAKVQDYMRKNVIIGTSGMKISDIAKVMVRNGFRRIPIVQEKELVGVVTTRDMVSAFATKTSPDILDLRIDKIMKKPVTANQSDSVSDAAELMIKNDIGGLPVVEKGKVVGIITERDLLNSVIQ